MTFFPFISSGFKAIFIFSWLIFYISDNKDN
jgi:hypothetical protein